MTNPINILEPIIRKLAKDSGLSVDEELLACARAYCNEEVQMSLDPVREARVRKMVLNPSTWPSDQLCMKKISGNNLMNAEFGVMVEWPLPELVIFSHGGENFQKFESLDELIAAGWAVD